jgi:hypothetical protein
MEVSICMGIMGESILRFGKNVYSQNNEDGIIAEVVKRLKLKGGEAIEFGAPTMQYCSNTYNLPKSWNKYYYDIDPQEAGVIKACITPENVNEVIGECDILSIDVDGNDHAIWQAYHYTPALVIIEINSSISPNVDHFSLQHGCSFKTMNTLAEEKGYFLLCHTGNCLYVLNKYKKHFDDRDETFNPYWL